ncbi:hypothetical protein GCM10009647_011370 [Streptomyces sanglieri]
MPRIARAERGTPGSRERGAPRRGRRFVVRGVLTGPVKRRRAGRGRHRPAPPRPGYRYRFLPPWFGSVSPARRSASAIALFTGAGA